MCSSLGARKGGEKSGVGRRGGRRGGQAEQNRGKEGGRGGEGDALRYSGNVEGMDGIYGEAQEKPFSLQMKL